MNESELGHLIVNAATRVQESMGGAGLDAVLYRNALAYDLEQRGLTVERRTVPPGRYRGVKLARPETVDMIVNDQVIVLCKTDFAPRYEAEALSHLRITGLKLGLILNFGARSVKGAVRRVTNPD
jgi:GxxExxY protein